MKKLYSCFDTTTGDYLYSGMNSRTRRECIEAVAEYMNGDPSTGENFPAQEWALIAQGFEIHQHNESVPVD